MENTNKCSKNYALLKRTIKGRHLTLTNESIPGLEEAQHLNLVAWVISLYGADWGWRDCKPLIPKQDGRVAGTSTAGDCG